MLGIALLKVQFKGTVDKIKGKKYHRKIASNREPPSIMTYSADFRWRIVSLMHVCDVDVSFLVDVFGPKRRTIL